jgi:hypothetical protein
MYVLSQLYERSRNRFIVSEDPLINFLYWFYAIILHVKQNFGHEEQGNIRKNRISIKPIDLFLIILRPFLNRS